MSSDKVLILGAAGRVGMQIATELMRRGLDVVLVDILEDRLLGQKAGRLLNDSCLAVGDDVGVVTVYGGVDVLDEHAVTRILVAEQPDLVINYAIPITWDATKRLPNYESISAAGLGAFTPIQVLAPLAVGRAIASSGIETKYMVGNLPDITVPIITAIAASDSVVRPLAGAGNVGLNQVALRRQVAIEREVAFGQVEVSLVSHHVHWVAPREPGYSNEGPFLAAVSIAGVDVSDSFDDLRELMNRGVRNHYESDAAFSSTTGILASKLVLALLDDSVTEHRVHAPAPMGLPGGYPLRIRNGAIELDLPAHWPLEQAIAAMEFCHTLDGVQAIAKDGTVAFTEKARGILRSEIGFELPAVMAPGDIEEVARSQIAALSSLMH